MATPLATNWVQLGDLTGPAGADGADGAPGSDGATGAQGVSITDAEINGSGDLIITLSNAQTINAGRALGMPGGGIDFESSVATTGDLPDDDPIGTARYVQADGHLYVYEEDGGGEGVSGWTDVGPIRGQTGSAGTPGAPGADGTDGVDGADGVSVTGAAINGSGHLILTLSAGGPIDAGVARGADGADGSDGAEGEIGIGVIAYSGSPPAASGYRVGTLAIGTDGSLLRATA